MKKSNFFLISCIFFIIVGFIINILNSSLITYYYSDHIFMDVLHNLSLKKNLFEILINKYNIFGLPFIPINPILNLFSNLNYNLNNQYDYLIYLGIFRALEFLTYYLFVNYFTKGKTNLLITSLVFLIFAYHFNAFDHQSYVNFPIIIFNLTIIFSLYLKQNFKLFILIFFLGNFWSYLINPTYFFVVVFGPFLFFIVLLLLNKEYKKLLLSLLINLPFTIHYIGITSGTARFALGNLIKNETDYFYNFGIYNSKLFIIFILFTIILFFFNYKKKLIFTNEYKSISIILIFFSVIGALIKFNIILGNLPHPSYIDYSLQYIYLTLIALVFTRLCNDDSRVKFFVYYAFFSIILFKIYSTHTNIINYQYLVKNNSNYENTNLIQRYFWEKNEDFKFKNDVSYKSVLIDIPNKNSDYYNYIFQNNDDKDSFRSRIFYNYQLKHSLTWNEFVKNEILIDEAHSLLLNINSFLALNPKKIKIAKNTIGSNPNVDQLNDLFNIKLILSDRERKLKIKKIYNYNEFEIFLYEYPARINYIIQKIKIKNSYENDLNYFNKVIFVEKKNINKLKNINEFCKINNIAGLKNEISYRITSREKKCLAIFPIPFSHTNVFYNNSNKIETFKGQHYFHSAILKNNDLIKARKKDLFSFSYSSFIDYIEFSKS